MAAAGCTVRSLLEHDDHVGPLRRAGAHSQAVTVARAGTQRDVDGHTLLHRTLPGQNAPADDDATSAAGVQLLQRHRHRHRLLGHAHPARTTPQAEGLAEHLPEEVLGRATESKAAAAAREAAAWEAAAAWRTAVHCRLAQSVVRRALLLVAKHRVCLVDLFEIFRVAALVRMLL